MKAVARITQPSAKVVPIRGRRNQRPTAARLGGLLLQLFIQRNRLNEKTYSQYYQQQKARHTPTTTALRSINEVLRAVGDAIGTRLHQRIGSRNRGYSPTIAAMSYEDLLARPAKTPSQIEKEDRQAIQKCLQPLRLGRMLENKIVAAIMDDEHNSLVTGAL